jgi:hypothetical protein
MRVWDFLAGLAVGVALVDCAAPPQVGAGEPCNSLNECKPGLSCIEGTCDGDLTSIAGQVPVYPDAAPVGAGGTVGGSAGAAAGTGGGGATGAGVGPSDAGNPDR